MEFFGGGCAIIINNITCSSQNDEANNIRYVPWASTKYQKVSMILLQVVYSATFRMKKMPHSYAIDHDEYASNL